MATSTYHPNDTNCGGWEGSDAAQPPGSLIQDTEIALNGDDVEVDALSEDDGNDITFNTGSPNLYPGHRIKITIAEDESDVTQIDLRADGFAGTIGGAVYTLYLWDDTGSTWGSALDTHTGATEGTMTATITSNMGNYINASSEIYVLVQGMKDAVQPTEIWTEYVEVVITYPSLLEEGFLFYFD